MSRLLRHPLVWILLIGALLRLVGIHWLSHHPDEKNTVELGMKMLQQGTLLPEKMNYGSLPLYLQAALTWVYAQGMVLFKGIPGGMLAAAMSAGRSLSVLFSLGTVALVWLLTRSARGQDASPPSEAHAGAAGLARDRWLKAEPLAALAMAVALLPVQISHYATVDAQLAFFVTASLWKALDAERDRRLRSAVWAGVLAGLAGATKYTGVVVLFPLLCIPLLDPAGRRIWRAGLPGSASGWKTVALGAAVSGPVFVLAMPYAALRPDLLLKALQFESHHYTTGGETIFSMGDHTWLWNLDYLAHSALGPGLFLLAVGSAAAHLLARPGSADSSTPALDAPVAWHRGRLWMLAFYPLLVYAFTSRFPVRFDRNLLPLLPMLCAFFGVGVEQLLRRWPSGWKRTLVLTAALLSLAGAAERSAVFVQQITRLHPKQAVKEWKKSLPREVKVSDHGRSQTRSLAALQKGKFRYVVMSSHSLEPVLAHPERYPILSRQYPEIFEKCRIVKVFENPWFASDFFAPHRLLNSATINPYHGPTHWVLEVPERQGSPADPPAPSSAEAGSAVDAGGTRAAQTPPEAEGDGD